MDKSTDLINVESARASIDDCKKCEASLGTLEQAVIARDAYQSMPPFPKPLSRFAGVIRSSVDGDLAHARSRLGWEAAEANEICPKAGGLCLLLSFADETLTVGEKLCTGLEPYLTEE